MKEKKVTFDSWYDEYRNSENGQKEYRDYCSKTKAVKEIPLPCRLWAFDKFCFMAPDPE
jgi:hypothetical protein